MRCFVFQDDFIQASSLFHLPVCYSFRWWVDCLSNIKLRACETVVQKNVAPLRKTLAHGDLGKGSGPNKSGHTLLMLTFALVPSGVEPRSETVSGYVLTEIPVWKGLSTRQNLKQTALYQHLKKINSIFKSASHFKACGSNLSRYTVHTQTLRQPGNHFKIASTWLKYNLVNHPFE